MNDSYFALVSVEPKHEKSLFNHFSKLDGVVEVTSLFGEYDFLVQYIKPKLDFDIEGVIHTKILKPRRR